MGFPGFGKLLFFYITALPTHLQSVQWGADTEQEGRNLEMNHIPSPKHGWGNTGILSPSAHLSPSLSARMNLKLSGASPNRVCLLPAIEVILSQLQNNHQMNTFGQKLVVRLLNIMCYHELSAMDFCAIPSI